ncbi:MAG: imidazolonepropionase [Candidatus Muiribacteriota bacterium]
MSKKIIINANEILQIKDYGKPRSGKEMQELHIVRDKAVLINDEFIEDIISNKEAQKLINQNKNIEVINAENKVVMPGLCDSHTHLVFGGSREDEFEMRIMGKSYMEIMQAGGGIKNTVNGTRNESQESLFNSAVKRLKSCFKYGTTSVEIKSGYGLDYETEAKQLMVADKLRAINPEIALTFLGAHALPDDFDNHSDFINHLNKNVLPKIADLNIVQFCDIFCEKGVFSPDDAKSHLLEAKKYNLLPKMHADELAYSAAGETAVEVEAVSADHLLKVSDNALKGFKKSGTIATLLPATLYNLRSKEYQNARKMIDEFELPVALASDFNPGSSYCENLFFSMHLSCQYLRMLPAEVLVASTLNGAYAMGLAKKTGSIQKGKLADVIILDAPNYKYIPYHFGINPVELTIKRGEIL